MNNNETSYDVIVIGAGPAGYSAAVRAAQLGASVLLADKGSFGGACLNWGCIPTKFLWEAVTLGKKLKRASDYGIIADLKGYNYAEIQRRKSRSTELLQKSLRRLIESYGIAIAEGEARFASANEIEIAGINRSSTRYSAKKIIIATGSLPKDLPGLAIDHRKIIDSTDALNLAEAPKKLLIIGGGAIGIEMAHIFSCFGGEILLLEKEQQLLPGEDAELAAEIRKMLERLGVRVVTGNGAFAEFLPLYDRVLLVTGRRPQINGLALEKAGIEFSPQGIRVNEYLQSSNQHIYAAGDAAGNCYLAYTAQADGVIAAENALGARRTTDYSAVPRVVFSQPPAASVGQRVLEDDANTVIGRFPLSASGRAFIEGERTGWVKIIAEKSSGRILGGQVLGPHAEDLIALISMATRHRLTIDDLQRELFFHPSLSETLHFACETIRGACVDLPKKD